MAKDDNRSKGKGWAAKRDEVVKAELAAKLEAVDEAAREAEGDDSVKVVKPFLKEGVSLPTFDDLRSSIRRELLDEMNRRDSNHELAVADLENKYRNMANSVLATEMDGLQAIGRFLSDQLYKVKNELSELDEFIEQLPEIEAVRGELGAYYMVRSRLVKQTNLLGHLERLLDTEVGHWHHLVSRLQQQSF